MSLANVCVEINKSYSLLGSTVATLTYHEKLWLRLLLIISLHIVVLVVLARLV